VRRASCRNGSTGHSAYRVRWYPLPPILALVALGYVTYQTARDPVIGRPSLLVTLGILVASAGYYVLRRRHRMLRGPDD
jgi:hypothetical protein